MTALDPSLFTPDTDHRPEALAGRPALAFWSDVWRRFRQNIPAMSSLILLILFALLAMTVSLVSFPLLIDRDVGLDTAIKTSVRAVAANPLPMAAWGAIVAGSLVAGSIPLFIGLVVVVPVLGHATWHLYRKLVVV